MKNAITWYYTFETKNYPSTIISRKKVHKTPEVYGRKEGRKEGVVMQRKAKKCRSENCNSQYHNFLKHDPQFASYK